MSIEYVLYIYEAEVLVHNSYCWFVSLNLRTSSILQFREFTVYHRFITRYLILPILQVQVQLRVVVEVDNLLLG